MKQNVIVTYKVPLKTMCFHPKMQIASRFL